MEGLQRPNRCNIQRMENVQTEWIEGHIPCSITVFSESGHSQCPVCKGEPPNQWLDLSLTAVQYEAFDAPMFQPSGQHPSPTLHYGHLQHIVSVEFPEGNSDLCLDRGATFSFALFHQCVLTPKDPRLNRLNIHFYSEKDESLDITDILHVHGLIGRIRDGPNSWAIIDRGGEFSREAYLTQEVS